MDEWKDFKEITWRMALALTPAGTKEVVGAATMRGLTDVDNEKRIVTLHDITLVRANFPRSTPPRARRCNNCSATFLPPSLRFRLTA